MTDATAAATLLPPGAPDFLEGFATIHQAMRRDTQRLPTALASATTQSELAALERWYAKFEREVVHHHEREDDIVWVDLVSRAPGFAVELDRLEQDHHELDVALTSVRIALADLVDQPTAPLPRAAAVDAAVHLGLLLHDHLEREEAVAFPAMAEAYTAAEFLALEQRLLKATPLRYMAFELPWVMDGLPADSLAELVASLPAPIRLLDRLVFAPAYRRLAAPLGPVS